MKTRIARRFVVEGDAMFSSIIFSVFVLTKEFELSADQLRALRPSLEKFASADYATMVATFKQQAGAAMVNDPVIKASLDALDSLPRIVVVPLLDSYMQGALFILDVYEERRWPGVNKLYTEPPQSTEQVLHPERWFANDKPVRVTLPGVEDCELVVSDVIGELQWSIYFSLWPHTGDEHPERSWGGDRFSLCRDADGDEVLLVATSWDTVDTAKGFFEAYVSTLDARYKDRERPLVVQRFDRVFIIDGGDQEMMDSLVERTDFRR